MSEVTVVGADYQGSPPRLSGRTSLYGREMERYVQEHVLALPRRLPSGKTGGREGGQERTGRRESEARP